MHEAEELCNEIAIINEGKLIAHDTTVNIKSFLDKITVVVDYNDNNFDLSGLNELNLEIKIKDMSINETNLEDVFLKLTKS